MLFRSNDTATTEIYTLSLHDALPIFPSRRLPFQTACALRTGIGLSCWFRVMLCAKINLSATKARCVRKCYTLFPFRKADENGCNGSTRQSGCRQHGAASASHVLALCSSHSENSEKIAISTCRLNNALVVRHGAQRSAVLDDATAADAFVALLQTRASDTQREAPAYQISPCLPGRF